MVARSIETPVSAGDDALALRRRNGEDLPFPGHPEGWFQVGYSDELAAGQVAAIRYFGRDMVIFRTQSGRVQVLDAHCAHLGAHLGVGGAVVGERLRCPFHAWEYGVGGTCEAIPYSRHRPSAGVAAWPTQKSSGLILVWYSEVANPPSWQPPEMPGFGSPDWTGYEQRKRYLLHTKPREIKENIVDLPHFQFVHSNADGAVPPQADLTFDRHMMRAHLEIEIRGKSSHTATTYGPGLTLNDFVGFGKKRYWTSVTPVDDKLTEVNWSMITAHSAHDDPTGEIAKRGCRSTLREFEKDIPIWENKIFRPDPILCRDDGPIGRFRMWYEQFYPQSAQ